MLSNMVSQITSLHQVDHQVNVVSILESVVHIDQERMVELRQKFLLIHNRVDTPLTNDTGFSHLFHSK
jgi:hypothetical protein